MEAAMNGDAISATRQKNLMIMSVDEKVQELSLQLPAFELIPILL
jgi:hypothetical protein